MKNADTPASPKIQTRKPFRDENSKHIHIESVGGLTKREQFAAMAMQGLLANQFNIVNSPAGAEEVAKNSVMLADALLGELEK